MTKFRDHKYTLVPGTYADSHQWTLVGPKAGMQLRMSVPKNEDHRVTGGIEIHRFEGDGDTAPSHTRCWLTGGRCWHDGSSLYIEKNAGTLMYALEHGNHDSVFRLLEREYTYAAELDLSAKEVSEEEEEIPF